MKFHKIISLVVGISSLAAMLLLMDVRSSQATGECVERVVEDKKPLILKESDVLALVEENAQILEITASEPVDERYLRLTGCTLTEEEFRTYLRSGSDSYVALEIPARDAPEGIGDEDNATVTIRFSPADLGPAELDAADDTVVATASVVLNDASNERE